MIDCISLEIPESNLCIKPGYEIKLGRFESETWICNYGWYCYAGNRPVCGWYIKSKNDASKIKPIFRTDLDDIYFVSK